MNRVEYKKYKFKQTIDLIRFMVVVGAILAVVIWAPSQAVQIAGYLGVLFLGASKAKQLWDLKL